MKTSMQSTNKPRPQVPSSMDVCDLCDGSGPRRIHTGAAKNIWVKKNRHSRGERLKIATYNVRTLLKDEHVQELEAELKENSMAWDVIGFGEVRRKEEFHNSPKWPSAIPLRGQQWTSRCRLPRKQEMERQHKKSIL